MSRQASKQRVMISRSSKVPQGAKSQRAEGRGDAEPAEQRGRRELIPPLDRGRTTCASDRLPCLRSWGGRNANPRGGEPKARATRQTVAQEPADPLSPSTATLGSSPRPSGRQLARFDLGHYKLARCGRTVLWFYCPGLARGGASIPRDPTGATAPLVT